MDITHATLKELSTQLQSGALTSEQIVTVFLKQIETHNTELKALLGVAEDALDQAKTIDARRKAGESLHPLAGIPIVLKDNILVKGWKATAGSKMLENYHASYDATVVTRLRQAGMILLGRANMDEFAMGSSTENSFFGPTKNPWDTRKVSGGSSGGSIVSVAAGFAPVALGSDTGGSVRQPASLCGIVGLKPTYGRVSRFGLMALGSSLDQISVATKTVEDAAMLLQVIEGEDKKDATTSVLEETTIPALLEPSVKGLRLGVPKEYFVEGMDSEVKSCVEEAIEQLKIAGAEIVEVSLPHTPYAIATYYLIQMSEASSNLGRYDGVRYGYSSQAGTLKQSYEQTRETGFGAEVKRRILLGTFALSAGYYDAYYKKASQVRTLIKQDFDQAFTQVDALLTPTSPSVAWNLGEKFEDPLAMYLSDIYTVSVNLATVPALSLPCGFAHDLPVGLQVIARPFDEQMLYRVGMTYQTMTDWHTKTSFV
ncbi:MAG: Glutamyl-tRNA(Gln) amidotransferase subunit A [Candidatus Uhrbacteria bacterium GW2011_GWE2_40_58]|nr:MAG: Glutamyl-tRNA(Gln) amidotransferase subunit A [Candidatus Uhrbacteria bacterium GW2011_GWF2_40_263]KKR67964.1 MAG: Glutamyl-tRNA(Gln) amidotransferase subunit A [Candidatus Uhrbacteria bacterium GW2011_GWE2_40_58]OGL92410.1 MAG: aspartyl/glutamyl-tRNA amidotransferase subunit A [Candidatus Uhrbacteria bacterium RIFOXYA2_FULL_40_9]OGL97001.1 MAG: aspartyl/glutamyl-tRNA amidotransferase subunit A [Candidatus Uhrbacteria bacterium RIFOXYB2_FULL_41_18]HBK34761.1 Asp-tRNA(Asn)/Glu-tRNA(Gln) 